MTGLTLRLDHINLPARKPGWAAEWYAEMFGLKAQDGFVLGAGVVLMFKEGEPLHLDGKPHFGFRSGSREQVVEWAHKLAVNLIDDASYCGFQATDPEGYIFEVYWEEDNL